MRLPSVKKLLGERLVNTRNEATLVRHFLSENKLKKANKILDMYGVETIGWPNGCWSNCQEPTHTLEYFNAGDTYNTTLLRIDGGSWFVGCWGDTYESMERKHGEGSPA